MSTDVFEVVMGGESVDREETEAEQIFPRRPRRLRERDEPVGRSRMVHPEGRVAERLGLLDRGRDDGGRHSGEERESLGHHRERITKPGSTFPLRADPVDASGNFAIRTALAYTLHVWFDRRPAAGPRLLRP